MYRHSAELYDALYHFKDYAAASVKLHALIQERKPDAQSLLDVGCGTGKHLEFLRQFYRVEGLDVSSEMLEVARQRCPDIPFHDGNMIDFYLSRTFDVVVCLFSSIGYVKTPENLVRAVRCMASHLLAGGILIVEPWFSPDRYWKGRITANFVDEPERKIAWMYTSEGNGLLSVFDIHYLVGTPEGVTHFTERHEMGLFTEEQYAQALRAADLEITYDPDGLFGRGMYVGTKVR
jgi:SAM-dependent methyltransferase